MVALNLAQSVRMGRAELLRRVRCGEVGMREALDHPAAQSALAFQFLASARYSRNHTATNRQRSVLEGFDELGVKPYRLVSELSAAEKDAACQMALRDGRRRRRPEDRSARGRGPVVAARVELVRVDAVPLEARREEEHLPAGPLVEALKDFARRTGRRMTDAGVWAGSDYKAVTSWQAAGRVSVDRADRALVLTDLLWWEVWPPEDFPHVAAIFEPEAVAA